MGFGFIHPSVSEASAPTYLLCEICFELEELFSLFREPLDFASDGYKNFVLRRTNGTGEIHVFYLTRTWQSLECRLHINLEGSAIFEIIGTEDTGYEF